jgi:hypothetical protein
MEIGGDVLVGGAAEEVDERLAFRRPAEGGVVGDVKPLDVYEVA